MRLKGCMNVCEQHIERTHYSPQFWRMTLEKVRTRRVAFRISDMEASCHQASFRTVCRKSKRYNPPWLPSNKSWRRKRMKLKRVSNFTIHLIFWSFLSGHLNILIILCSFDLKNIFYLKLFLVRKLELRIIFMQHAYNRPLNPNAYISDMVKYTTDKI